MSTCIGWQIATSEECSDEQSPPGQADSTPSRGISEEVKNATLRGSLVAAAEVERTWTDVLRRVRSQVLAVPSRVRSALPHLTASDVAAFDHELRDSLAEIGGGYGND